MAEIDEWVSLREFARRIGVTPNAVTSALKSGRIVRREADKKIHWPTQSRAWYELRDLSKVRRDSDTAEENAEAKALDAEAAEENEFRRWKTLREKSEAGLKEVKLAQARGELVRASAVRDAMAQIAIDIREGVMTIPDRVASELAGELASRGVAIDTETLRTMINVVWRRESRNVLNLVAQIGRNQ